MLSTQSRLSAKLHAQRTVCSACGLHGPPAHTPAPAKPQKGSRCVPAPFWHMQVKVRSHVLVDPCLIVNSQLCNVKVISWSTETNYLIGLWGFCSNIEKIFKRLSYIYSWYLKLVILIFFFTSVMWIFFIILVFSLSIKIKQGKQFIVCRP